MDYPRYYSQPLLRIVHLEAFKYLGLLSDSLNQCLLKKIFILGDEVDGQGWEALV